jgi:hypothetical protein
MEVPPQPGAVQCLRLLSFYTASVLLGVIQEDISTSPIRASSHLFHASQDMLNEVMVSALTGMPLFYRAVQFCKVTNDENLSLIAPCSALAPLLKKQISF